VFKVWYLEFMGEEGNTFNTTFGCENMACRPFSSEPLEMLLPATSAQFLHMGKLMMCIIRGLLIYKSLLLG
jgi:hypothetical protein